MKSSYEIYALVCFSFGITFDPIPLSQLAEKELSLSERIIIQMKNVAQSCLRPRKNVGEINRKRQVNRNKCSRSSFAITTRKKKERNKEWKRERKEQKEQETGKTSMKDKWRNREDSATITLNIVNVCSLLLLVPSIHFIAETLSRWCCCVYREIRNCTFFNEGRLSKKDSACQY